MRPADNKSYFHFTRKERTGIFFLISMALVVTSASIIYPHIFKPYVQTTEVYASDISRLEAKSPDSARKYPPYKKEFRSYNSASNNFKNTEGELFYFDPNTISENEWRRLGLRDKTISIIQNYLSKGGRFREAVDIKKIWGLHEDLANRLMPYARIANLPEKKFDSKNSFEKSYPGKTYRTVNINEADTLALTQLPGIGPKLSQRIIKYRNKLGGFYEVDQIAETFGLPDSTFKKIRVWLQISESNIKKININAATLDELKAHPYIRYNLANALIQYRQQHKNYSSVSEIRNIMLVDDTTYQKLAPYLAVE